MSSAHEERLELLRQAIATIPDQGDGACRFCVLWEAIQDERAHDCDEYGYGEAEQDE